jgi:hypothetical protein
MMRVIRRQREILYARIDTGKVTVRTEGGTTEAVILLRGPHADVVRELGKAGYTLLIGGCPAIIPDGRTLTILVRRRLATLWSSSS